MIKLVVRHWWLISGFSLLTITLVSLLPFDQLPQVSGSDKMHHLLSYAFVAIPIALRKGSNWWVFLLLVVLWGGAIEWLQPLFNRHQEWLDALANAMGVIIGAFVGLVGRYFTPAEIVDQ